MTLEESVDEVKDTVEQVDGLRFVYEQKVSIHLKGKVLDYITGANEGFTLHNEHSGGDCGEGCCH